MDQLYAKLNQCKIKAVALSLIDPFADQFIDQSCSVLVVLELFLIFELWLFGTVGEMHSSTANHFGRANQAGRGNFQGSVKRYGLF